MEKRQKYSDVMTSLWLAALCFWVLLGPFEPLWKDFLVDFGDFLGS